GVPGHVELANAASLNELSVCLGNDANTHYGWYRTLRNLNPQVDPSQLQPPGTRVNLPRFLQNAYKQSCTNGKWVVLADQLQNAQLPTALAKAKADPPPSGRTRQSGVAAIRVFPNQRGMSDRSIQGRHRPWLHSLDSSRPRYPLSCDVRV